MIIEAKIIAYLSDRLGMDVYPEIPKNPPERFAAVQIVDRSRENMIDAVTAEIYSYGKSKLDTIELDSLVREAMLDISAEPDIMACHFGGGNDSPDTALKRYRYRSYFNITY